MGEIKVEILEKIVKAVIYNYFVTYQSFMRVNSPMKLK